MPFGYRTNVEEVLDGYRRLRQQNAILLPAHDYEIFIRYPKIKVG